MERVFLNGRFLCCAWNQRTTKEVLERGGGGHGLQLRNEITKYGGGRETKVKHCLLQHFAWSLPRKRQNFPGSHPWVQILALPILARH